MDDHIEHDTMTLRGHRDEREVVWLACIDCLALIRTVRLCGCLTKKGKVCRAAVLDDAKSACRVHSQR